MKTLRTNAALLAVTLAPLGCATVSDFFNEPPAEPQPTEQTERGADEPERTSRDDAREQAKEEAREAAREQAEGAQRRASRDYIAASACPMQVAGVNVRTVDIVDGIALEFIAADDDDVEQVRERARRLINTQREVRSARFMEDPELDPLPPARVEYDPQRQGARVDFKVDRASDLRALREGLRQRVDVLREEGECPREIMTMLAEGASRG